VIRLPRLDFLFVLTVFFASFLSGCIGGIQEPPISTSDTAEKIAEEVVRTMISDGTLFDLQRIVESEERFEMHIREVTGDLQSNASFAYDRTSNTSKISLVYASPQGSLSYIIIEGGGFFAIKEDEQWRVGRDLDPNFEDPFNFQPDSASLGVEMPVAELPIDVEDLVGLEWSITHDLTSGQSIALADNESATIILTSFFDGGEVELVSMEIYGSNDAYTRTVNLLRAEDVNISFPQDSPRLPVPLLLERTTGDAPNGTFWQRAEFTESFRWEVLPSDLDIRIGRTDENGTFAILGTMTLGDVNRSWVDDDGENWWANWTDADADGLVSASDHYDVGTTSNVSFGVAIYDSWADAYSTDMVPSISFMTSIIPVLVAALLVARRERR
jgi:hypothetical protein